MAGGRAGRPATRSGAPPPGRRPRTRPPGRPRRPSTGRARPRRQAGAGRGRRRTPYRRGPRRRRGPGTRASRHCTRRARDEPRPDPTPLTAPDRRDTTGAVQEASASPPAAREAASVILARDAPGRLRGAAPPAASQQPVRARRLRVSRRACRAVRRGAGRRGAVPGPRTRRGRAAASRTSCPRSGPSASGWPRCAKRSRRRGSSSPTARTGARWSAASLGGDARARCREDSAMFGRLLAELDMVLATDRVAYWAHWITPEERPIRYDTRFFVAAAWPEQVAEPDGLEMVAARWIRPEDALAQAPGPRAGAAATDPGDPRVPLRRIATSTPSWRRPTDGRSGPSARASSGTAAAASASCFLRIPAGSETGPRRRIG